LLLHRFFFDRNPFVCQRRRPVAASSLTYDMMRRRVCSLTLNGRQKYVYRRLCLVYAPLTGPAYNLAYSQLEDI
jgi:hypothetical protein